jgi:hypothetical protein
LACEQKNEGISRDGHQVMIVIECGFRTAPDKVCSQDIFVLLPSFQVNVKTKCHPAQNMAFKPSRMQSRSSQTISNIAPPLHINHHVQSKLCMLFLTRCLFFISDGRFIAFELSASCNVQVGVYKLLLLLFLLLL